MTATAAAHDFETDDLHLLATVLNPLGRTIALPDDYEGRTYTVTGIRRGTDTPGYLLCDAVNNETGGPWILRLAPGHFLFAPEAD